LRTSLEPSYDEETGEITPEYCRIFNEWLNATNPELNTQAVKEMTESNNHGRILAEQDIHYLLKFLKKNYRRW